MMESCMAVIGLDLGGTKLAGALFDDNGRRIETKKFPIAGRKGHDVGAIVLDMLDALLIESKKNDFPVRAVGVSVPGISYRTSGHVWAPNIPGWEDYPLLDEIKNHIGNESISIDIDSDRSCYILGESWAGAAKGLNDAIYLAVGTGIGAGIMAGGEVLRGSHDIAGAIGWMALDRPYYDKFIPVGCFEYHASGDGIARVASELIDKTPAYSGRLRAKPNITSYDVFEAYNEKDQLAAETFNIAIEFWGMATANLVSLFNPEKILFGGGMFGPAAIFLEDIAAEAAKWAQPISMKQVKIEKSLLGGESGLYGAGYLALKSLNKLK